MKISWALAWGLAGGTQNKGPELDPAKRSLDRTLRGLQPPTTLSPETQKMPGPGAWERQNGKPSRSQGTRP